MVHRTIVFGFAMIASLAIAQTTPPGRPVAQSQKQEVVEVTALRPSHKPNANLCLRERRASHRDDRGQSSR